MPTRSALLGLVVAVAAGGCTKHEGSAPAPAPATPTPAGSAAKTVEPPKPTMPSPSTTLRIRVASVYISSDDKGAPHAAMCRPDEQLTGGSCNSFRHAIGKAIGADGHGLDNDAGTFGAGWDCGGTSSITAQAFCLSDSSITPAEAAPK